MYILRSTWEKRNKNFKASIVHNHCYTIELNVLEIFFFLTTDLKSASSVFEMIFIT